MLNRFFGPPSRDKFARMILAGIRKAGERRKITFDSEQFCLRPEGDEVSVMNLSNLYAEFCAASKEARPKLLGNIVRNWFADRRPVPECYEDIHPDLLPTIRSRAYFEFALLQLCNEAGRAEIEYPQQVLADHLAIGLVYDLPDSMRTIVGQDLEHWGVTFYEALEAACANLRQKEDPVFLSPAEGVYFSATGDNYDASRMILLDMIRQFDVKGDVVAMVPNRDTLIITGADDLNGLKIMLARAQQAMEEPRPISMLTFTLVDEEWQEWIAPLDHPLYEQFALLRLQSFGQQYAEQKELLENLYHRTGEDLFVASFSGMQNSTSGQVRSYCVWPANVPTLLPRTDLVSLMRSSQSKPPAAELIVTCRWEDLEEVAGSLLEPQEMYPERWLTRGFPDDVLLEQLRALSKDL